MRAAVALLVVVLASPAHAAPRCSLKPPRTFPQSGAAVPPNVRIALFVREDNPLDFKALEGAKPVLESGRVQVALRRDPAVRRSAVGERVFVYTPVKPLVAGTWRIGRLPKLSPFYGVIGAARWVVEGAPDRVAPVVPSKEIDRTRCTTLGAEERVCVVALKGRSGTEPLIAEARLVRPDGRGETFTDIVGPGAEVLLRNDACASAFARLEGAYDLQLALFDAAGNASEVVRRAMTFGEPEPPGGHGGH